MCGAALHVAVCLLIRPLPSYSAVRHVQNLPTMKLLWWEKCCGDYCQSPSPDPQLGRLLYTEGFQASEDTLHYLPSRRPDFHGLSHVTVVPSSGLLMAVTSGKLLVSMPRAINKLFRTYS